MYHYQRLTPRFPAWVWSSIAWANRQKLLAPWALKVPIALFSVNLLPVVKFRLQIVTIEEMCKFRCSLHSQERQKDSKSYAGYLVEESGAAPLNLPFSPYNTSLPLYTVNSLGQRLSASLCLYSPWPNGALVLVGPSALPGISIIARPFYTGAI